MYGRVEIPTSPKIREKWGTRHPGENSCMDPPARKGAGLRVTVC